MSEPQFLQALYEAGAAPFFDIVAAKPYGFWSGPEDRRIDRTVLNFSRAVLMRDTMVANGDSDKPIWAVEMGWNALPAGWAGGASPWGTDEEALQSDRTLRALDRARVEWPWLTALALAQFRPPRMPLIRVRASRCSTAMGNRGSCTAPCRPGAGKSRWPTRAGMRRMIRPSSTPRGWRARPAAADPGGSGDAAEMSFYGTRIDLAIRRGQYWGLLYVTVDDRPANGLPRDNNGQAYVILYDPLEQEATVTLASGLSDGLHRLKLTAEGGWGQWPVEQYIVSTRGRRTTRAGGCSWPSAVLFGVIGLLSFGYQVRAAPWARWWPSIEAAFERCLTTSG